MNKIDNRISESSFISLSFRIGPLGDITERISKIFEDGIKRIEAITKQQSKQTERK